MCPFANKIDSPCSGQLTLENLNKVLSCCVDNYDRCPVYQKLQLEQKQRAEHYESEHSCQRVAS